MRLDRYPLLKRFHPRISDRALWSFNRGAVARAVAVGFFFGILTPVAQIIFALVAAIAVRANLLVAAASTMITNPFILPFVYYYAYRIGAVLTGRGGERAVDVELSEEAAERALDVASWLPTLAEWASSVGLPLVIGVAVMSASVSLVGYLTVHSVWRIVALVVHIRARRANAPAHTGIGERPSPKRRR